MERRIAAAGIVLLLLSAFVVVQILDPQFGERTPPEVDFSAPPNEVAADAAKQFEYVDYAYRVDVKYDGSNGWRQWGVTYVDHSNRAYRKVGPLGESGLTVFSTDTVTFLRPGVDGDWQVTGTSGIEYPERFLTQPLHVDRIRETEAGLVAENTSTVTIQMNVSPMKVEGDYPGDATLVVNRRTGIVESVFVAYNPHQTGTRYLRLRVIEIGTTVERPEDTSFSSWEIFWDLLRGPLFRIEWLL